MARPPELIDDIFGEILLRLPPDDPACLIRVSLVCKPWRRLLSDPAFLHRYRAFHGAPPLLGFFRNFQGKRFVATTAPSPIAPLPMAFEAHEGWMTMDCRHGRALHDCFGSGLHRVPPPGEPGYYNAAAVLCGVDGCDHLDFRGGPFLLPEGIVVTAEDNRLGFAGLRDDSLYLWLWQAGADGSVGWTQDRLIKVKMLLPILEPSTSSLELPGFIEGTDTIIISANVGVFAIMLNSREVRKLDDTRPDYAIVPYKSFYTPDLAKGIMRRP
uniref:F-box domain-containing protein n=1 Tax=Setaria italica TaxID=4555 RepID=K3YLA2_SETIT